MPRLLYDLARIQRLTLGWNGVFRIVLAALMATLFCGSAEGSVQAVRNLFAEEFSNCPSSSRLDGLAGLRVSRVDTGQLRVQWRLPDPEAWQLRGFTAYITVIADGPGPPRRQDLPPYSSAVTFDDIDASQSWRVQVAVTDRGFVLSDIVEYAFNVPQAAGTPKPAASPGGPTVLLAGPRFASPFYWRDRETYEGPNGPPVGTFYYLGFNPVFDNWYIHDADADTSPPRFRVGLRHGETPSSDFEHFRIHLEDSNGDDVLGFDAETLVVRSRFPTYKGAVFALGDWRARDCRALAQLEFANVRIDAKMAAFESSSPVYFYWRNEGLDECPGSTPPVSMAWFTSSAGYAPRLKATADRTELNQAPAITDLAFTHLADSGTRQLFALPPDQVYGFPQQRFPQTGEFVFTGWAEDQDNTRISDRTTLRIKVSQTAYAAAFSNLMSLQARQRRSVRTAPAARAPYWVFEKATDFPDGYAVLAGAQTEQATALAGSRVASADLESFYGEGDIENITPFRVYGPVDSEGHRAYVPLQASESANGTFLAVVARTDANLRFFLPVQSSLASPLYGQEITMQEASPALVLHLTVLEE